MHTQEMNNPMPEPTRDTEVPAVRFPFSSIRIKLLTGVLLILIPVFALILLEFNASFERRQQITLDKLQQTSQAITIIVDYHFSEAIAVGTAIAHDPDILSLDNARIANRLRILASFYPEFNNISFYDASGQLQVETASGVKPRSIADRPYFQRINDTKTATVVELVVSKRTGLPATGVVSPVFDESGIFRGVVILSFDLDILSRHLVEVGLQPGQVIGLLDNTGRLALFIAHDGASRDLSWDERDLSKLPEIKLVMAGENVRTEQFMTRTPTRIEHWMGAFSASKKYQWISGIIWPTEIAYAPVNQSRQQQLLGFGLIVLTSFTGAWLFSLYLTRPIKQLAVAAADLGRGNYTSQIRIRTGDEIEQLGTAFSTMSNQIQLAHDRNQKLYRDVQEALRQRNEFFASITHDLQNPLTMIKGYAQLLQMRTSRPNSSEHEHLHYGLDQIISAANMMTYQLQELIDLARLQVNKELELFFQKGDFVAIVKKIIDMQQLTTQHHEIVFNTEYEEITGTWDISRIERVITNLVNNAIKYSPAGGKVIVTLEQAEDAHDQHWVALSVTDSGFGIPPDDLPHIFTRYRRGSNIPSSITGSGIGLSGSLYIIEKHGGTIHVSSEEGNGSTFTIRLPVLSAESTIKDSSER